MVIPEGAQQRDRLQHRLRVLIEICQAFAACEEEKDGLQPNGYVRLELSIRFGAIAFRARHAPEEQLSI